MTRRLENGYRIRDIKAPPGLTYDEFSDYEVTMHFAAIFEKHADAAAEYYLGG